MIPFHYQNIPNQVYLWNRSHFQCIRKHHLLSFLYEINADSCNLLGQISLVLIRPTNFQSQLWLEIWSSVSWYKLTHGYEMMHNIWSSIENKPCCFSRSTVKFQGQTGQKNRRFWPELNVSRLQLKFAVTDGFEMRHRAWCGIEKATYCIERPSIEFQGHAGQKMDDFDPNRAF